MKKVKSKGNQKLFIFVLVTMFILSTLFPTSISLASASETKPSIEIDTSHVDPGETGILTINAENIPSPGLAGYQLNLIYDQQVIEVLGVEKSSLVPFGLQIANTDIPGVLPIAAIEIEGSGVTGNFPLSYIKIRVKDGAKGSTELKIEGLLLAMANKEPLDAELTNGLLQVSTETADKIPNEPPEEHQVPLTMNLVNIPPAIVNQPYSVKLSANNGKPPYKWSSTELPDGLKLNEQTGEITGIPTVGAKTNFVEITVSDSSLPAQSVSTQIPIEVPEIIKGPQIPSNGSGKGTNVGGTNNGPKFVREGENRYRTALAIALAHFSQPGPKNVLVANGYASADALAGAPLAFKLKAPIILSSTEASETTELNDYITKTRALGGKIVLLGGTGVINSSYSNAYTSMQKQRIGGENRRETAVMIARELLGTNTTDEPVVIVNENAFVDAISIAPFAAQEGWPILLTTNNELSPETSAYLDELKPSSILVIGSTGVVNEKVYEDLRLKTNTGNITRIGGQDRFETNAQVLEWARNRNPDQFTSGNTTYAFANGDADDVIDALAGAALGIPIVLVHNKNELSDSQKSFLQQQSPGLSEILGSSGVIDPVINW